MIESFYFGWTIYFLLGIISIILLFGNYSIRNNKVTFIVFTCILFFILGCFGSAITPDYPSYEELIYQLKTTKNPSTHLEYFWIQFIHYIDYDYLNYRIVLYLLIYSIFGIIVYKLSNSNITILLSLYILLFIVAHIGLRASLFLMIFTLGIIELSEHKYFLSIILFFIGLFIHKVAYFAIPILAFTILIPINKCKQIFYIILFLLGISSLIHFYIFSNSYEIIDYMWKNGITGSSYLEREDNVSDRGNIIWRIIDYITSSGIYIVKILILIALYKYYKSYSKTTKIMYGILLWSTIFSLSILFIGLPDRTLSYRCATIGDIPMCYLWGNLAQVNAKLFKNYKNSLLLIVIVIFIMQNIFIRGILNRL